MAEGFARSSRYDVGVTFANRIDTRVSVADQTALGALVGTLFCGCDTKWVGGSGSPGRFVRVGQRQVWDVGADKGSLPVRCCTSARSVGRHLGEPARLFRTARSHPPQSG